MPERKRHPGRMGVHRADPNTLQNIPLPIYPRSLGNFLVPGDYVELVPAGTKNFVQFFWCVDGEGEFELEDTPVTVRAGDCFYHLPMEPHVHRAHSNLWEYRWVAFDGPFAREFMLSYQYPRTAFHAGACPHELFLELETWMREMSPYSWRQMVAIICALLARAGGRNDDTTREGRVVNEAIRVCRERFSDPDLNVNRLADELAMDRSTLRRIFKQQMCMTPSDYLAKLRIQHALSLLDQTRLPLAEVADRSGFSDVSYFCRVIRRAVGISPGSFRAH